MKKRILILISLVLLILDNSLIPFLAIKGACPSLLFILAVVYSMINGRSEAVVIGVVSGLVQDIFFYDGPGINALMNMLIRLIAAIIGGSIYRGKEAYTSNISYIIIFIKDISSVYNI